MAASSSEKKKEENTEGGGELLFCGATSWDIIGRRKGGLEGNLLSPTRLRPLLGIDIRFVASGCGKKNFRFCDLSRKSEHLSLLYLPSYLPYQV